MTHDKFCVWALEDDAPNDGSCLPCERIARVRADERKKAYDDMLTFIKAIDEGFAAARGGEQA